MMPNSHAIAHRPAAQRGVVLIIALITMAVIAISSAAAIRSAMSQDQVGNAMRAQSLAMQAAESMIRYCESAITANVPTAAQFQVVGHIQAMNDNPATPPLWRSLANWSNNAMVNPMPAGFQDGSGVPYNQLPQCMIQQIPLSMINLDRTQSSPSTFQAFVVVARGFSPDYRAVNGNAVAGAEVWLESTIQVAN
jgi:Tfp pilus assembly protein PilX